MAVGGLAPVGAWVVAQAAPPNVGVLVLLLLVGVGVTMLGLSLLTGRRTPAPTRQGAQDPAPGGHATPRPVPAAPCDWELRVDTDGRPVVLRAARGRPCCIHTLVLRSLDPAPAAGTAEERLTWSGDATQVTPTGAATDTRRELITSEAVTAGTGLHVRAAIERATGPRVSTSWLAVPDLGDGIDRAERLWETHLQTLRDRQVRTHPEDAVTELATRATTRTRVRLLTERNCAAGHHLTAHGTTGAELAATASPNVYARLDASTVEVWLAGHLDATVTTDDLAGHHGDRAATDEAHLEGADRDLDVVLGATIALDLALGTEGDEPVQAAIEVTAGHRLEVEVHPSVAATPDAPTDLQCACDPTYRLDLGGLPHEPGSAPPGWLTVDGSTFAVHRASVAGADGTPRWWSVQAGSRDDRPGPEGDDGDAGDTTTGGPAADGRRAGAGEHLAGHPGRTDGVTGRGDVGGTAVGGTAGRRPAPDNVGAATPGAPGRPAAGR